MTQLGLQPEEWGGDTMFVDVSAKTHEGLDELLEGLLLMAEIEELTANPDTEASGTVIESKLDPGRGAVVTVLVQRGTLKIGDALVAGAHWGRVRAMSDYTGKRVKTAPAVRARRGARASTPSPRPASTCASSRTTARPARSPASAPTGSSSSSRRAAPASSARWRRSSTSAGDVKELSLVLKADVSGSLEAFEDEIAKLPQDEVQVDDRAAPASAASRSPTSTWPRPRTRS